MQLSRRLGSRLLGSAKPTTLKELLRAYEDHRTRRGTGSFRVPVEVVGMARTSAPLRSGLDSSPCIFYEYRVERQWKRRPGGENLPLLGDQDSAQGQDLLMSKRKAIGSFRLTDQTHELPVDSEGAEFVAETVVERLESPDRAAGDEDHAER